MSSFATKAALLGAFASTALAHGTVTGFLTDGTYNQGFLLDYYYMQQNGQTPPTHYGWYAENLDNGFVEPNSYGEADIICHKNSKPASATAKVAAGGKVDFQWTNWPESHIGPVITYVAKCDADCADQDKTTLKFVKIDEAGYDTTKKSWAAVDMIANNNTWSTTVPESLAPGNYVFRHEIIALHGAGSENGAQNYPQCVNIEVTGSGTESPEGTLGTALYKSTDPGILFNPYTTITSYEIPGPALFGSGSSGSQPGSGSGSASKPASSAVPSATPAPSTLATSAATPVVTQFSTAIVTDIATATVVVETPAATSDVSTPAPSSGGGSSTLPKEFTLDTFISWLQEVGKSSGVARRHARQF